MTREQRTNCAHAISEVVTTVDLGIYWVSTVLMPRLFPIVRLGRSEFDGYDVSEVARLSGNRTQIRPMQRPFIRISRVSGSQNPLAFILRVGTAAPVAAASMFGVAGVGSVRRLERGRRETALAGEVSAFGNCQSAPYAARFLIPHTCVEAFVLHRAWLAHRLAGADSARSGRIPVQVLVFEAFTLDLPQFCAFFLGRFFGEHV